MKHYSYIIEREYYYLYIYYYTLSPTCVRASPRGTPSQTPLKSYP